MAAGLGTLLMLAAEAPPARPPASPAAAAAVQFAPPIDRAMAYRVTTRRLGRDGALLSFSLHYALIWRRAGRGYRLEAVLERIESDARPEVTRALTAVLQPLVGQPMTYLVPANGATIDLVAADDLWDRALARTQAVGAEADRAQAQQMAQLLAALPADERNRLATADIRALVAPANPAIAVADGSGVAVTQAGALRTIATAERARLAPDGAGQPLHIDTQWTVDTATGMVQREQRQSWIVSPGTAARTLVEERVRALSLAE
ncbi:hypothetical protein [Sphingopyxis sp.]|uniref:hypothetical protein n=1 Tax=Sphingopyxis sp. TaxID=1908224 RepID=UPI003D8111D3